MSDEETKRKPISFPCVFLTNAGKQSEEEIIALDLSEFSKSGGFKIETSWQISFRPKHSESWDTFHDLHDRKMVDFQKAEFESEGYETKITEKHVLTREI